MAFFGRKKAQPQPQPGLRTLAQLMDVDEPAWTEIVELARERPDDVRLLPVDQAAGEQTLLRLQITVRSYMGAVARYSGGILIDGGWIRLLGGGYEGLPDMASASGFPQDPADGKFVDSILIGHDVLGGMFRIAGSGPSAGNVLYYDPTALAWDDLELGYGQFVGSLILGDLDTEKFYEGMRWSTWREDTAALRLDQAFSIYPPLFTAESKPIENTSHKPVPVNELIAYNEAAQTQLGNVADGNQFVISVN